MLRRHSVVSTGDVPNCLGCRPRRVSPKQRVKFVPKEDAGERVHIGHGTPRPYIEASRRKRATLSGLEGSDLLSHARIIPKAYCGSRRKTAGRS
jgi:hypothetical protein